MKAHTEELTLSQERARETIMRRTIQDALLSLRSRQSCDISIALAAGDDDERVPLPVYDALEFWLVSGTPPTSCVDPLGKDMPERIQYYMKRLPEPFTFARLTEHLLTIDAADPFLSKSFTGTQAFDGLVTDPEAGSFWAEHYRHYLSEKLSWPVEELAEGFRTVFVYDPRDAAERNSASQYANVSRSRTPDYESSYQLTSAARSFDRLQYRPALKELFVMLLKEKGVLLVVPEEWAYPPEEQGKESLEILFPTAQFQDENGVRSHSVLLEKVTYEFDPLVAHEGYREVSRSTEEKIQFSSFPMDESWMQRDIDTADAQALGIPKLYEAVKQSLPDDLFTSDFFDVIEEAAWDGSTTTEEEDASWKVLLDRINGSNPVDRDSVLAAGAFQFPGCNFRPEGETAGRNNKFGEIKLERALVRRQAQPGEDGMQALSPRAMKYQRNQILAILVAEEIFERNLRNIMRLSIQANANDDPLLSASKAVSEELNRSAQGEPLNCLHLRNAVQRLGHNLDYARTWMETMSARFSFEYSLRAMEYWSRDFHGEYSSSQRQEPLLSEATTEMPENLARIDFGQER